MIIATKTAQQGDITLTRLDTLPEGELKIVSENYLILAQGSSNGNTHSITQEKSMLIKIENRTFAVLPEDGVLEHQEHKPIKLSAGNWEVEPVNEFDYFAQMARKVID